VRGSVCDKPSQPTWYRPRCGRASLSGEARLGCEVQNEWAEIPHHSPEIRTQCKSRVFGYSMAANLTVGPWAHGIWCVQITVRVHRCTRKDDHALYLT